MCVCRIFIKITYLLTYHDDDDDDDVDKGGVSDVFQGGDWSGSGGAHSRAENTASAQQHIRGSI